MTAYPVSERDLEVLEEAMERFTPGSKEHEDLSERWARAMVQLHAQSGRERGKA